MVDEALYAVKKAIEELNASAGRSGPDLIETLRAIYGALVALEADVKELREGAGKPSG